MAKDEYDRHWRHLGGDVGKHCRDCEERHSGCHSTCEKYLEAKEQHEQRKEKIEEAKSQYRLVRAYSYDKKNRERKGLNRTRHGNNQ